MIMMQCLQVLTHLLYVLNVIKKDAQQTEETRRLLLKIHRINPRNSSGDSLLHLVVSKDNAMKSNTFIEDPHTLIFPDAGVAQLLIDTGANVDALNDKLSSPLHVASTRQNYNPDVIRLLLERGAHIDRGNLRGDQPHKLLAAIGECTLNPLQFISLKCLAARKIKVGLLKIVVKRFLNIF